MSLRASDLRDEIKKVRTIFETALDQDNWKIEFRPNLYTCLQKIIEIQQELD